MIKSISHKGLRNLFETGNPKGVRPDQVERLRKRLAVLDTAVSLDDIEAHNWKLHALKGKLKGQDSIGVSGVAAVL